MIGPLYETARVTSYIAVLLIAVVIVLLLMTRDGRPLPNGNQVGSEATLQLARISEYEKLVSLGERQAWKHSNDPKAVMAYGRALVETGKALPDELRFPNAPSHVATFAEAYMDSLRGHVNRAESAFTSLTTSEEGGPWGYVGLLEQSLMVRNFASMGKVLEAWKALREPSHDFEWVTPYYWTAYLRGIGQYDELAKLLARSELAQGLRPEYLTPLRAELLVRDNNFSEAHAVLDEAIAAAGMDSDLVYAKASVISAEKGLAAASAYLKASQKRLPKAWSMEFQRLLHEVEGNIVAPSDAASALVSIARRRVFDVDAAVTIASILFDLNNLAASVSIIDELPVEVDDLLRFASYNLLMAKFDAYQGLAHSREQNFRRAREMDPASPDLLWFEYQVARMEKNQEKALRVLHRLLELDPNDKPAMQAATRVYEDMDRWEDVLKLGDRFFRSKRIISAKAEDEVRSRLQRAAKVVGGNQKR